MPATIVEFTGVYPVPRIIIRYRRRTDEQVYGCHAGIGRNVIQSDPTTTEFDAWFGMSGIEVGTGGTHWTKGTSGNDIYLLSCLLDSFLSNIADNFFGGNYYCLTIAYFAVYFLDCF